MVRIRSHRSRVGAMAGGVVVGLVLLASVLPSEREPPAPTRDAPPARDAARTEVRVRRPPESRAAERAARVDEPAPIEVHAEPTEPDDDRPLLVVDVVDEDGRPAERARVMSIDCPGFSGGPPGAYRIEPGTCLLRAGRRDGALLARGKAASVEVHGPDPVYVQLELPSERTGGIGIRFLPVADGVEVLAVQPNTPAWDAGLEPGDVIVAVGGETVAGKDSEWFVDRMTGAVGSEVEFTVGFESDTGTSREVVRVTRAFLEI